MAKYVVMAVANERVKRVWKDNQTKKDVVFFKNVSTSFLCNCIKRGRKCRRNVCR